MSRSLKMTGGKELEQLLAQLPTATAKSVGRRVMKKRLKPVADFANALWPGSSDDVFRITSRVSRGQIADSHMQRDSGTLNMFVGAPGGALGTPEAHLIEFGTGPRYHESGKYVGAVSASPMLQPAWEANRGTMLRALGADLFEEIQKSLARRAAK
ncbi:hypothetical protein HKX54_02350 [Sulfitobacter sp. M57]|nr:hypothetical protein [Sulfitobacter sp. KE5]MDF3421436.1 hypothetical protein [Sulfitobacter sp. KE43]MDF3431831.1 hypothetical protein [Sulfitobacter sp. KE42]MDF3457471.1 hypothetical protein [Sulfitobacter sp. S74]MDF3461373.1 hypothetical protein [Sulfitobacter sp. Ks18]MDF3465273.1 hypothetical protein [Sulfitobacter sp. M05]MDF3469169.1 hypothetical protein [Sulfitobacter sp. M28]MDF3472913.1 hypothetical protein [Sulfitobacter sp. M48]MDF3476820.1 hypothetical protein [Sulfitobact